MSVLDSLVSISNSTLRKVANLVPNDNPLRMSLSRTWTKILKGLGSSVTIPIGDQSIRLVPEVRKLPRDYEAETLNVWLKLLDESKTVWDVGANIGLYSVLSAKRVGASGKVSCWEPAPDSQQVLKAHLKLNGVDHYCHPHQAAVSDNDGDTMSFGLVSGEGTDPTNRLGGQHDQTIDIPVESLDGIQSRKKRAPDFLKIDIEGAEVFALRGAEALMADSGARPTILLAVHPMFLPEFGCDPQEIAKIVADRGYRSYDMQGSPAEPVEYNEYLLVPTEKVKEVLSRLGWQS